MNGRIMKIVACLFLVSGTSALADIYMVMPQDGGASMHAGLNRAEGSEGWRPEMPGDNPPISIVLTAGALPSTSLGQNYRFTIPTSWTTITGDDNFNVGDISYNLNPVNSSEVFSIDEGVFYGNINEKKDLFI